MQGAIVLIAAFAVACSSDSTKKSSGEAEAGHVTLEPAAAPARPDPSEPPVITYSRGGGANGRQLGAIRVWSDGTVRFAGPDCPNGRRGSISPARVTAVLDQLEAAGLLVVEDLELHKMGKKRDACCDCVSTGVAATRGVKTMHLVDQGCGTTADKGLDEALKIINRTFRPNPC